MQFRPLRSLALAVLTPAATGFVLVPATEAGVPGSTSEINVDVQGIGLGGYDPVAYFYTGKPTSGLADLSASHGGARYLFASAAHRAAFLKDPDKYVPEFGGFCAVGASFGEKVDVDPKTGKVVAGKLYLNNSTRALQLFDKDQMGVISKANANWPSIKDKAF